MYIAVDIGGTNTRVAGTTGLSNITFSGEPLRRRNGADYADDIRFIIDSARSISHDKIEAVGVGLVGELSDDKTTSLHSKNNGHWNGKAFAHDLSRELGCPVFAENDGVAAALGEAYFGSVTSDFAYIIWGTGIGGALVAHDSLRKPSVTMLDWHTYFKDWEFACGGSEISKLYNKQPESLDPQEWKEVLNQFRKFAARFSETVHPEEIVFGGGLSVLHSKELGTLTHSTHTPCRVTSFDGNGGLYGALAVIRHGLESQAEASTRTSGSASAV